MSENQRDLSADGRAALLEAKGLFEQGLAKINAALGEEAGGPSSAPEPKWVSLKEAAHQLDCHEDTVKRLCREHEDLGGPAGKIGEPSAKGKPWLINIARAKVLRPPRSRRPA